MKRIFWSAALLISLAAFPAQSQTKPAPEQLSRFFDRAVPRLMEEFHVAGVTVGVADSGDILFLGGYGNADLDKGTPVDPRRTLFRVGSITKLFVWTALMQLEEQGALRLEDPVTKYLDYELPDNFAEPIRIIDLMNHTPGFEDRLIGIFTMDKDRELTLEQTLKRDIPRRVRPPATEVSYSNYGAMLGGYIVQRISGMPFEMYVKRNILDPLGMSRSTFDQPPSAQIGDMATGYTFRKGEYIREKFEIGIGTPAGALSATAADILRFYQAYLNGGQLDGSRILEQETVRRMQQPTFRHDRRANGTAYGFFESGNDTVRALGHGGDSIFFHSGSAYLPNEDLAYYISSNTSTGMALVFTLEQMMLAEFFPAPTGAELAAEAGLNPDLEQYTGFFAMNRRSESDPTQIIGAVTLVNPKISEDGKGLFIASMLDPSGSVYVPVAPDIFQQQDGGMRIVFLRDDAGEVRSLYADDIPAFLFNRPPGIEHPAVSLVVLILGVLLFLTALIAPPTGLLTLIPRLRSPKGEAAAARSLALWSGRAYLILILAEVGLIFSLGNLIFAPVGPLHALPLYLGAAAAAVMIVSTVLAWRRRLFRLAGRLHYSAFALFQALLIAWCGYWGFFFV